MSSEAWGVLSRSAAIVYFIQCYQWQGESRTHIFLYLSSTGLNSLSKICHHVDSDLSGMALAVKETPKCLQTLSDFKITIQQRLISDSQTCLSLCCIEAVQLNLLTGLVILRVQETFGFDHLYYAPGKLFNRSFRYWYFTPSATN